MTQKMDTPTHEEGVVEDPVPQIDWTEVLTRLWDSRRLIVMATASVTVVSIIVSLLLPEYYRSTTTILPETEKNKLSSIGGLSDLAALAGVNVASEGSLAKLYPTIIRSEAVLRDVIYADYETTRFPTSANLLTIWNFNEKTPERSFEVGLAYLRENLDITLDNKTSVVAVSIETREPKLSADILNNITAALDRFIRSKKMSTAGDQRKFIEGRMREVSQDLERSEDALRDFREKNRRVGDSPELQLEQGRRIREVEINTTLYTELKKQYEIAKIEEIKNLPIINIMDAARPAAKNDSPKKTVIVVTSFILSLIAAAFVFGLPSIYRERIRKFTEFVAALWAKRVRGYPWIHA